MIPQPLSRAVSRVTVQALDRKSARLAALLGSWESVIGPALAEVSLPVKLARGEGAPGEERPAILHLAVMPAWKTEFQHETPLLLERINRFFGYRAVEALRFSPRTLPRRAPPLPAAAPRTGLNYGDLDAKVSGIEDAELRAALLRLGQSIRARQAGQGKDTA